MSSSFTNASHPKNSPMPTYFFHLAFELYYQSTSQQKGSVYNPDSGQNLFVPLPDHQISALSSSQPPPRPERTRSSVSWDDIQPGNRTNDLNTDSKPDRAFDDSDTAASPRHYHQDQAPTNPATWAQQGATRDWRFDEIRIESIDIQETMPSMESTTDNANEDYVPLKARYVPTNPKTTEFGWGVIHLYRDADRSPELNGTSPDTHDQDRSYTPELGADTAYVDEESTTLCILAVPSYMTPSDLLGWLGEETRELVTHVRMVKTGRSNRYMVLLKFRESNAAKEWQKQWSGKLFSSAEWEDSHIVFIRSIQFHSSEISDPSSFPNMNNDPFTPVQNQRLTAPSTAAADPSQLPSSTLSKKPAPPPTPALVEVPTCPVCLERMDETAGLATTFCQHVFHCACLQKWKGSGCPVCRHTQNDPWANIRGFRRGREHGECKVCAAKTNLWVCLICGNVGCGRYDEAHAYAHWEATAHAFAMDLSTQHIWDYAADGYAHRLIQDQTDGKLLELPSAMHDSDYDKGGDLVPSEKVEKLALEYTHLLSNQLEVQRVYFEEQIDRAVDKAAQASAEAENAAEQAAKLVQQNEVLQSTNDTLAKDRPTLEKERQRAERKADKFEAMARKMEKEWREKDIINESLSDRIKHLEKQLNEVTLKNSDLEEQNRDLGFFISGMEKLKNQGEDIQQGTLSVPDPLTKGGKKKGK